MRQGSRKLSLLHMLALWATGRSWQGWMPPLTLNTQLQAATASNLLWHKLMTTVLRDPFPHWRPATPSQQPEYIAAATAPSQLTLLSKTLQGQQRKLEVFLQFLLEQNKQLNLTGEQLAAGLPSGGQQST